MKKLTAKEKKLINKYNSDKTKYSAIYFLKEYAKYLEIINNKKSSFNEMQIAFSCIIHVLLNCEDDFIKKASLLISAHYNEKIIEKILRI